ncbi:MAG: DUF565 domain-containing protein [Elainellaceae cyanobacterium]
MQDTRLNRVTSALLGQLNQWLSNPWRRISLIVIGLLFGNFVATVAATVTGQNADWDVLVAVALLALIEFSSWLVYSGRFARPKPQPRPLAVDVTNAVKLGLVYGLFVEAFKLGS